MTPEDVERRAVDNIPGGPAQFDPLTLLVISAIISAVVRWLVTRCLNRLFPAHVQRPGVFARYRFRQIVRECCSDPAVLRAAGVKSAAEIDDELGKVAYHALLATGAEMSDDEVRDVVGSAR